MFRIFIAVLTTYLIFIAVKDPIQQPAFTPDPQMVVLLNAAKKYMRHTSHVAMPPILAVSQRELEKMYCSPSPKCPISAMYYQGNVYYSTDLRMDDILAKSIIVHEFVHHLQREKVGDTYDCAMWYRKEKEAYRIQAAYLRDHGYDDKIVRDVVKTLKCPVKDNK